MSHCINNNLKQIYFLPVYILIIILPFLPIISEIFLIKIYDRYTLLGFSKEILVLFFTFIVFSFWTLSNKFSKISIYEFFFFSYFIYGLLHIFITSANLMNAINNFRLFYIYVLLLIFMLILSRLKKVVLDAKVVMKMILLCSFLVSLIGLYEKFINPDIINLYKLSYDSVLKNLGIPGFERVRIASTLGNPINLGVFLDLGILSSIYFIETSNKKTVKLLCSLFIPLFIFVILLTLSRTAFGSSFLILAFYSIYKIYTTKSSFKKTIFLLLIASFIISFMIIIYNAKEGALILLRIFQLVDTFYIGQDPRLEKWNTIMDQLSENIFYLLFGMGLGNSGTSGLSGNYIIIENAYLSILYELGLIGLFLFITIIFIFLTNALIIYKKIIDPNIKSFALVSLLYLFAYLFAGLFMDIHVNNPFSFYFWLFLALILSYKKIYIYRSN
jgi:O-antigen ligase